MPQLSAMQRAGSMKARGDASGLGSGARMRGDVVMHASRIAVTGKHGAQHGEAARQVVEHAIGIVRE